MKRKESVIRRIRVLFSLGACEIFTLQRKRDGEGKHCLNGKFCKFTKKLQEFTN